MTKKDARDGEEVYQTLGLLGSMIEVNMGFDGWHHTNGKEVVATWKWMRGLAWRWEDKRRQRLW